MAGKVVIGSCSVWKHCGVKTHKILVLSFRSDIFGCEWKAMNQSRGIFFRDKALHHIHLSEGCLKDRRGAIVWRNRRFEGSAPSQPFVTLIFGKCDN